MTTEETLGNVRKHIEEHFEDNEEEFVPGESTIRLSCPTFGSEEVLASLESLLSTQVTMGDKVQQFETSWSEYVDAEYSHMVNSGSSANLLALKSLEGSVIEPGDEVIVPAVAWSTSLFPILDVDATPVLVDVDRETYTIDVDAFREAITERTSAAVLVHLLGNPCNMDALMEICDDHDIAVVEDCCEAHGAKFDGKSVGSFGELGTFSFFFSHHITTIEGGMVVSDDLELSERVRMARAHGWIRELDDPEQFAREYPDIDQRFLFKSQGYNLRPTEIQGAFGEKQLPKLGEYVDRRRENAEFLNERLSEYSDQLRLFSESERGYCSWFAYPIQIREGASVSRDALQDHLEANNIETRPILAGNLARQPALDSIDHRIAGTLSDAQHVHENGMFIGNHHRLSEEKLEFIANTIGEFFQPR